MRCQNCIDEIYMDDLGDGFYRCPVCGDEQDTKYPPSDPFEDYDDEPGCPVCGSSQLWEFCDHCGGEGQTEPGELYASDPLWHDFDDVENCSVCEGAGGWYICLNAKNHPVSETE